MNAIELARQAYAPAQTVIRTPRSVEAQLFAEITSKLGDVGDDYPALAAALHQNRQLWNALAIDVADRDNGLPSELRARIFYLAQFTEKHSQQVLRGEAEVAPLIEINTTILRGLQSRAAQI